MPRLALAVPSLAGGGAEISTLRLARGLLGQGHSVDLLLFRDQIELREELPSGARKFLLDDAEIPTFRDREKPVPHLRHWTTLLMRRRNWRQAHFVAGYLQEHRPDVLLPALPDAKVACLLANRLVRRRPITVPVIRNDLRSRSWRTLTLYRDLLRDADHIVAVSSGTADSVPRCLGIPASRVSVIYNPVISKEITHLAQETPDHPWLRSASKIPIVLAAGRLARFKDFPTLIRAFDIASRQRPLRLIILGEGSRRGRLEALVRSRGLGDRVSLPGWVRNPFACMSRASVVVTSSRYEGLSNVLIQALACGCPCVSTDCPSGSREILQDGRIGPLVPVGDYRRLAGAILNVLEHPPPRQLLLERARCFSAERALTRYQHLLAALLRN